MKTAILFAGTLVVSGAVLLAQTPGQAPEGTATPGRSRTIQRVLVKVNGEVFTQTQLEHRQIEALKDQKINVNSAQDLERDSKLMKALADVTPDILVESVDELLLVQHGRELGIHMTDERFNKFVDGFKADKNLTDAQLKAALAEEGLTMDAWREMAEHQMIIQDVQSDEILPKAQVTEEELHQYYNAHHDEFMTPATMTFREILIAVPTQLVNGKPVFNAAVDEVAKEKAIATRERIIKGEDFLKVVVEVSDNSTKDNGGLLGTFPLDDIDPSLRAKVEPLKVGEMTEPLRTQKGYQILKVDAVTTPELKPFEKVRDNLRGKVSNSRLDVEQQKFLVKIRADALIEWKDPVLKAMYDKRVAERAAGK